MTGAAKRLAQVGARVGESPLWLPDRKIWLWLDMQRRQVRRHDPATGEDRVIADGFAEDLACMVRWTDSSVLLGSVRGLFRLALNGTAQPLPCPTNCPPARSSTTARSTVTARCGSARPTLPKPPPLDGCGALLVAR